MVGRTPAEAVHSFLDPLQQAIACVTREVLSVQGGYHPAAQPHFLSLGRGRPVWLLGGRRLSLLVQQRYRIVETAGPRGPSRVSTAAYSYALSDDAGRGLLAYHWHPGEPKLVTWSHLHVRGFNEHPPTGRVALGDVLRVLISEFAVRPLRHDWAGVLDRTQLVFNQWRTW